MHTTIQGTIVFNLSEVEYNTTIKEFAHLYKEYECIVGCGWNDENYNLYHNEGIRVKQFVGRMPGFGEKRYRFVAVQGSWFSDSDDVLEFLFTLRKAHVHSCLLNSLAFDQESLSMLRLYVSHSPIN